ncbi:MAG TPA: TonB family protein [Allosphingosinicella sp.]|jgi:protein TonB
MMEGAFYQQKRTSPTALTVVVLMHGAALTALALAKSEVLRPAPEPPIVVENYKEKDIPPEVKPEPVDRKVQPQQQTVLTPPKPVFDLPTQGPVVPWTPPPTRTLIIPQPGPIVLPKLDPPAPPAAKEIRPARARANLASYVSDADYPTTAVRNEEQGTTRFKLAVGPDGKVRECTVTSSSGSPALDATTCKLMRQRAKFTPATGTDGKPTGDTVASAIRWVLPSD